MSKRETNFSWQALDALMQLGVTKAISASVMDCSEDTIDRRILDEHSITFSEYRDSKLGITKTKLIQTALKKAFAGENVMLIFALKNLCGWSDKGDESKVQVNIQNNVQQSQGIGKIELEERIEQIKKSENKRADFDNIKLEQGDK